MNAHADQTLFLPMTRSIRLRIEATIDQLLALLDEIDGDPDLEAASDDEDGGDAEPDSDDEPSLGALNNLVHQGAWGADGYAGADDRERQDEGRCPVEDDARLLQLFLAGGRPA